MTNIFGNKSSEDEILAQLETLLAAPNAGLVKEADFKLAKAADLLNEAAQIFDMNGKSDEADEITKILIAIANAK